MDRLVSIVVGAVALTVAAVVAALTLNFFGVYGDSFADMILRGTTGIAALIVALWGAQHIYEKLCARMHGAPRARH